LHPSPNNWVHRTPRSRCGWQGEVFWRGVGDPDRYAMNKIAFIVLLAVALCSGCSDRQSSATMRSFSPSTIVLGIAKRHKLDLSETGSGQGVNSGHEEKDWHYYSPSKADDLEAVVREIHKAFQEELGQLGATIHGTSAEPHAFIVYSLEYTQGSREGTLRIVSATLEKGTGLDIIINEHPE